MFNRNQVVHWILWPTSNKAQIALIDPHEGVYFGAFKIDAPMLGSQLSKLVPRGLLVELTDVNPVSMAGEIEISTRSKFDTAVVVEREKPSLEERFERLERRTRRAEARAEQAEQERRAARRAAREQEDEGIEDETLAETPVGAVGEEGEGKDPAGSGRNPETPASSEGGGSAD